MNYFKSTELAEKYGVSRRTITNWIEQTRSGRLQLELTEKGGRVHILRTQTNQHIMEDIVSGRRKFLNKRSLKEANPIPEFYDLYNKAQILDMVSNIQIYGEIPRQYNYFNGGAQYWDKFARRLYKENTLNMITATIELFDANLKYLDRLLENYQHVNVIDVCAGNGLPVKALLEHLIAQKKLKRYAAVDISQEMLQIAEKNMKEWFGESFQFESYCKDINFERFPEVLAEAPSESEEDQTVNLVLLLGGTLMNFREPEDALKIVNRSMQRNDIFVYTTGLDSKAARERFNFTISDKEPLPPQYKFIVDKLGIDPSYYNVEVGFDHETSSRFLKIRFKHALTINFDRSRGLWPINLNKDDTIILWRARHDSPFKVAELLYGARFNPLLTAQTHDHNHMMVMADVRVENN